MWSVQWEVVSVSSWGPPPRASLNQPGSSLVMTVGLLLRSRRGSQPDRASHPWGGGGTPLAPVAPPTATAEPYTACLAHADFTALHAGDGCSQVQSSRRSTQGMAVSAQNRKRQNDRIASQQQDRSTNTRKRSGG